MTSSGERQIDVSEARRMVAEERASIESSLAYLDWTVPGAGRRGSRQAGYGSTSGSEAAADRSAIAADLGSRSWRLEADLAARRVDLGAYGRDQGAYGRELGAYGRSVEGGAASSSAQPTADPLGERTVGDPSAIGRHGGASPR